MLRCQRAETDCIAHTVLLSPLRVLHTTASKMSDLKLLTDLPYTPLPNQPLQLCTRNLRLTGGTTLHADCLVDNGSDVCNPSSLDLNAILGNQNGRFHLGSDNFAASARNVRLEGTRLLGALEQCRECGGGWNEDSIDLELVVCNKWGELAAPRRPADGTALWDWLQNMRLDDGHILHGDCANLYHASKTKMHTSFDLNTVVGNMNGHFHFGTSGFMLIARNVRLEGMRLVGELRMANGTWRMDGMDLDTFLCCMEGRLVVRG